MKRSLSAGLVFITLALANFSAHAQDHRQGALIDVLRDARHLARRGERPVVIFDIDDTLVDTRERMLRILLDFVAQPEIEKNFPNEAKIARGIEFHQIGYSLSDSLAPLGMTDPDFVKQAKDYWLAHFFTNEACANDVETPGAAAYLRALTRAGATLVYLTGRDVPRMGDGTLRNLKRNRFPLGKNARLIMKPAKQGEDLAFKISKFPEIEAMGRVIAAFENEPVNANAFQSYFPRATTLFIDTIHSPKPDVPNPNVVWLRDFRK